MNNNLINQIFCGDAEKILEEIDDSSIDIVLTDPPYFLDKMDNTWKDNLISSKKNQYTVKSLPAGMRFDREQGKKFYEWYLKISEKLFRVLKPGGFFFSFSSPRLYHRMACAVDDAGFNIRDCFIWLYLKNQVKAMSLDHFIDKLKLDIETKKNLKDRLEGWKTPQIKSCFEPILMAQKQYEETFLKNVLKYNVGLFNIKIKVGQNMFPSNILVVNNIEDLLDRYFLISKPAKKEKGLGNTHKTVKPITLCEYLIELSSFSSDATILDPFSGSGTTLVAAKKLGKNYIGIDINPEYVDFAKKRIESFNLEKSIKKRNIKPKNEKLNRKNNKGKRRRKT